MPGARRLTRANAPKARNSDATGKAHLSRWSLVISRSASAETFSPANDDSKGGRNHAIMTPAETVTPIATSEPSCARPGSPPKLSSAKAPAVVTADHQIPDDVQRRTSASEWPGCVSRS